MEEQEREGVRRIVRFAWLPVRMGMGYWLWLGKYTEMQQLNAVDDETPAWETLWRFENAERF